MKSISTFVIALLVFGFFFIAMPEKGNAGFPSVPGGPPCCQVSTTNVCAGGEAIEMCEVGDCIESGNCTIFPNAVCEVAANDINGSCVANANTPIPTLSEWGIISIAVVLGIVGFMVIRRRKATV